MAFDPSKYTVPEPWMLPVILLVDVSNMMLSEGIDSLHSGVERMISDLKLTFSNDILLKMSILTYGGGAVRLHIFSEDSPYISVYALDEEPLADFVYGEGTPMGVALRMCKDMIEDREITRNRICKPVIVLISSSKPTDAYEGYLNAFITEGRSSKCDRLAVAVGDKVDRELLERFTGDKNNVFVAGDESEVHSCFRKVDWFVSDRVNPRARLMYHGPVTDEDEDDYEGYI